MHRQIALVRGVIAASIFRGIDIKGDGIDVDEYRLGPDLNDRTCRSDKTERRGDHFVAGADPRRHQREDQSIRAGGATNGKSCAQLWQRLRLRSCFTSGPRMKYWLSSTLVTAAITSSRMVANWALEDPGNRKWRLLQSSRLSP